MGIEQMNVNEPRLKRLLEGEVREPLRRLQPVSCVMRRQRGQSLVELGLIIPVVVLMLVGIVEFARFFAIRNTITDAARMGARAAVLPGWHSQSEIESVVRNEISSKGLDADLSTTSVSGLNAPTGSQTVVTVQYRFSSIILSMIRRSSPITVRSVSTMIHE